MKVRAVVDLEATYIRVWTVPIEIEILDGEDELSTEDALVDAAWDRLTRTGLHVLMDDSGGESEPIGFRGDVDEVLEDNESWKAARRRYGRFDVPPPASDDENAPSGETDEDSD